MKVSTKAGMSPGSLVFIGEKKQEAVKIDIIDYDHTGLRELHIDTIEDCLAFQQTPTVTWLNVSGVHDTDIIEKIGRCYDIHPLVLEDILNTNKRPKADLLDRYIFIVLKVLSYNSSDAGIEHEQISIILTPNTVISFQEREQDVFAPVRQRIRKTQGRIRTLGSDYLAYALLDVVVDNYFIILEKLGEDIEVSEEKLIAQPKAEVLKEVHRLKKEMLLLRKSVWPLREVITQLMHSESPIIKKKTAVYFRDIYEHTIQVIDTVETYRDMISGLLDLYLSSVSNRMNEVMKVLTMIATVFIPLTFIAGIYGMNFEHMPELGWRWAYFAVLGVMCLIAAGMFLYFKRKKWL